MAFTPASIIGTWLRGLLAIAVIAVAAYCFRGWYEELPRTERVVVTRDDGAQRTVETPLGGAVERIAAWRPGFDGATQMLVTALLLTIWATCGRILNRRLLRPCGDDEPRADRTGEVHRLRRSDGTEFQAEVYGPPDGAPVIFTHGWGLDSTIWYYAKRALADRYRVIVWDLPGSGLSTRPRNEDFSLERMAHDLRTVLDVAGDRPAVLVGHSIGGMTIMTFARLFPQLLKTRIAGILIAHSTYTNPLRTRSHAAIYTALQKPVIEPLLRLTIVLSPLVWVMTWLSYLNGSAHSSTERSSFVGTETRGQLDFTARFNLEISPAVLARGFLGMLEYEAPEIAPLGIPALVVVGDQDTQTLPQAGDNLRARLGGNVESLAPAKHLGFFERHGEFVTLLRGFLDVMGEGAAVRVVTKSSPRD
jgi:pimeloyl-ACP methyl ester carboxylesterase